MKIVLLLNICAVTLAYTDIEPIDVDALVQNPDEMKKYMECYLDKGPCTPTMKHIKGHIIDAITNACKNCTPKEKHEAEEFAFNILLKYPDYVEDMKKKYDPEGKNFNNFIMELSKY